MLGKYAPPEAVDFVKFLSSVGNQTIMASSGAIIPVVKGAESGLTDPLLITIQQHPAAAQYFQLYYDQYLPPAMGTVVNDSTYGIFANTLTPFQAAQAIEDFAKNELK